MKIVITRPESDVSFGEDANATKSSLENENTDFSESGEKSSTVVSEKNDCQSINCQTDVEKAWKPSQKINGMESYFLMLSIGE